MPAGPGGDDSRCRLLDWRGTENPIPGWPRRALIRLGLWRGVRQTIWSTSRHRRHDLVSGSSFRLRRARYFGQAKTHLQHVLTAAAINLVRLTAWFAGDIPCITRTPRFVAVLLSGTT